MLGFELSSVQVFDLTLFFEVISNCERVFYSKILEDCLRCLNSHPFSVCLCLSLYLSTFLSALITEIRQSSSSLRSPVRAYDQLPTQIEDISLLFSCAPRRLYFTVRIISCYCCFCVDQFHSSFLHFPSPSSFHFWL